LGPKADRSKIGSRKDQHQGKQRPEKGDEPEYVKKKTTFQSQLKRGSKGVKRHKGDLNTKTNGGGE